METYVAVTGPIDSLEWWETDMRAIKFPRDSTGDGKKDCYVRCGVCPMRMYKIVHPEDQQEALMNHIGVGKKGEYVTTSVPKLKKYLNLVRKLLGLKKCPLPTKPVLHMQPTEHHKAVAVVPIGTKKDNFNVDGVEQL